MFSRFEDHLRCLTALLGTTDSYGHFQGNVYIKLRTRLQYSYTENLHINLLVGVGYGFSLHGEPAGTSPSQAPPPPPLHAHGHYYPAWEAGLSYTLGATQKHLSPQTEAAPQSHNTHPSGQGRRWGRQLRGAESESRFTARGSPSETEKAAAAAALPS